MTSAYLNALQTERDPAVLFAEVCRMHEERNKYMKLAEGEVDKWIDEIRKQGGCVKIRKEKTMPPFSGIKRWIRRVLWWMSK